MKHNLEKITYEPLSVSLIRIEAEDVLTNSPPKGGVIELPLIPF